MEFKYFRWQVSIRIVLSLILGFATVYILTSTSFWLVSIWTFLAFLAVLVSLVRYVEKSHREMRYFLLSIQQGDFSNSYPHKKESELNYAFHTINNVLKNLRNEKASNLIYLQTVVEHINIAILCIDEEQKIVLANKAAKNLFEKEQISNLKSLEKINVELAADIRQMSSGDRELKKTKLYGDTKNLSIQATEFILQEKAFKLISFQDIKTELEINELESWQKLIRVLTHEIKNSVIPISTLADVILHMLKTEEGKPDLTRLDDEGIADLVGGIETIESRSKGLAAFVKTYDKLTKLPQPELSDVSLYQLVERVSPLFRSDAAAAHINIDNRIEAQTTVEADSGLIEQVVINLIKNAIEALTHADTGQIIISSGQIDGRTYMNITDNGSGIADEILENIFVPFYTTKEAGSGIGLALSRQIMRSHNGQLKVESSNSGTTFTLLF